MARVKVRARSVAIPVERATRISTRVVRERHYLLIEVSTSDGAGIGYAYAGTNGGRLLADAAEDLLQPVLRDGPADDIGDLWERMYQESLLAGRRGALLRAISAVDIALWDLRAKACGVPLAVLLGGSIRRPVPAYASGGYYRPDDGPYEQAVVREIAVNQRAGFADHEIKVGGLPLEQDAARVAAAIETIAGRGRLAIDANNAYRSVGEALRAVPAFERAAGQDGLWWFEEPLSPDNIAGHAQLARALETPVATGEIHQTRWEFAQLIERHAADVLQPDAGVLGGVTEWLRVAHAADTFGLHVAPHWHANLQCAPRRRRPQRPRDRALRSGERHLQLRAPADRGDTAAYARRRSPHQRPPRHRHRVRRNRNRQIRATLSLFPRRQSSHGSYPTPVKERARWRGSPWPR